MTEIKNKLVETNVLEVCSLCKKELQMNNKYSFTVHHLINKERYSDKRTGSRRTTQRDFHSTS